MAQELVRERFLTIKRPDEIDGPVHLLPKLISKRLSYREPAELMMEVRESRFL